MTVLHTANASPMGVGDIEGSHHGFGQRIQRALSLVWEAENRAHNLNCDVWDFAVEAEELRRIGLNRTDFRWLAGMGYIEHAVEVSRVDDEKRMFRAAGKFTFTKRSCVVLTDAGATALSQGRFPPTTIDGAAIPIRPPVIATQTLNPVTPNTVTPNPITPNTVSDAIIKPRWDADYRVVTYGGVVVKKFKLPSPNQEAILMAFEEESWPPLIHDPLMPRPELDPKHRLHDTIRSLNRNQCTRLLCFRGNGTGEGILWEPIDPASAATANSTNGETPDSMNGQAKASFASR